MNNTTTEQEKKEFLRNLKKYGVQDDMPWKMLKTDRQLALKAVKINGGVLKKLSRKFRADPEIAGQAADNCIYALKYCSKRLRHNQEFMVGRISACHTAYYYATSSLKRKKSFVQKSLNANGYLLEYLPEKYQNDEFLRGVANKNIKVRAGFVETGEDEVIGLF